MKKTTIPQRSSDMVCTTPDDWILHESIPFSLDSAETRNVSIGKVIASYDSPVEVPGFGEALHAHRTAGSW